MGRTAESWSNVGPQSYKNNALLDKEVRGGGGTFSTKETSRSQECQKQLVCRTKDNLAF